MYIGYLVLLAILSNAVHAEVTTHTIHKALAEREGQKAAAPATAEQQKIEQDIKDLERDYHKAVQEANDAKRNNASQADVAALEQKAEQAKSAWHAKKGAHAQP